jgi:hypothetical protein
VREVNKDRKIKQNEVAQGYVVIFTESKSKKTGRKTTGKEDKN